MFSTNIRTQSHKSNSRFSLVAREGQEVVRGVQFVTGC